MTTHHTPGPWVVGPRLDVLAQTSPTRAVVVAQIPYPDDRDPIPRAAEYRANARLLAAAPVLLEAAKAAVMLLVRVNLVDQGDVRVSALLSAAIAEAEGTA